MMVLESDLLTDPAPQLNVQVQGLTTGTDAMDHLGSSLGESTIILS